jgi:hypothetical protein
VAVPVTVEVRRAVHARSLIHALAARGLVGELGEEGTRLAVTITDGHDATGRLLADVLSVVTAWRREHGLSAVPLRVGATRYWIAGDGDVARVLSEARAGRNHEGHLGRGCPLA